MTPANIAEQIAPIIKGNGGKADGQEATRLVLAVAVVVLQITAIWQHILISGELHDEAERQTKFRQTVSCFLFEVTRPTTDGSPDRADILTRCGLIEVGEDQ